MLVKRPNGKILETVVVETGIFETTFVPGTLKDVG
jgi:hypothetical protein